MADTATTGTATASTSAPKAPAAPAQPSAPVPSGGGASPIEQAKAEHEKRTKLPTRFGGDPPTTKPAEEPKPAEATEGEQAPEEPRDGEAETQPAETPAEGADDTQEFEIEGETFTLGDLKEAAKHIQRASTKLQEAQRIETRARNVLDRMAKDTPAALLTILTHSEGGDAQKGYDQRLAVAVEIVNEELKARGMSPAERENLLLRHRLETAEQRAQRIEDERRAETEQGAAMQQTRTFLQTIPKALAEVGLDGENKRLMRRVAREMRLAQLDGEVIDEREAARRIRGEIEDHRQAFYSNVLKPDEVPEDFRKKLREDDLAKMRQPGGRTAVAPGGHNPSGSNGERRPLPKRLGAYP